MTSGSSARIAWLATGGPSLHARSAPPIALRPAARVEFVAVVVGRGIDLAFQLAMAAPVPDELVPD
ncbi:MAG: hypothetical protein H0V73_09570 [Chloroflexi bacterium]|nr:hypothetical protein [Chloroflexota bacterium]